MWSLGIITHYPGELIWIPEHHGIEGNEKAHKYLVKVSS